MLTLQIIIGSTREGRAGRAVALWFDTLARRHDKFAVELIDLAEIDLPLLDEPMHPRLRQYQHQHTKEWSARVERADAYVLVTPEYNYGPAPALVNALDYLLHEWAYKPVGFVSYGAVSGGTRAVQMTKQIVSGLRMVPMVEGVVIPFFSQYLNKDTGTFDPPAVQADAVKLMLAELARWAEALRPLRGK